MIDEFTRFLMLVATGMGITAIFLICIIFLVYKPKGKYYEFTRKEREGEGEGKRD